MEDYHSSNDGENSVEDDMQSLMVRNENVEDTYAAVEESIVCPENY